ncbi:hypothetical protein TIFTF001_025058 [Ficus carica]|uniref:Dirigent protein n=1 Tax=Ficus carica TaxID=3494 RepID=A0AA88ANL0_FICCA|nr:hypothetical protein TIFTF001_025058 [Ficus carica]
MTSPTLLITIIITICSFNLASTTNSDEYHTFSKTLSPKDLVLKQEKLTHLHFYFQDVVSGKNPTVVQIAGPKLKSNSINFGAVAVLDDPLTVAPELTSKRVGSAQGIYAATSQSSMELMLALNFVFTEGKYNGSTLSLLGHNPILKKEREMPIVGGSGVFKFARGHTREKITHLHFYFHDIFSGKNRTSVQVAGPPLVNSSPNFGAVVVIDDPLTVGPGRTSKQVGSAQGFYAAAGQSEIGLLMVFSCVFTQGKFNGSTLSILGHNAILSAVREMPIVGGSGLFRFAKGYVEARTYVFNTSTTSLDAVVEYNVYVFHNGG